jgi:hypothetical protein
MNAKACAVLNPEDQWRVIHDQVKRVQARIVRSLGKADGQGKSLAALAGSMLQCESTVGEM